MQPYPDESTWWPEVFDVEVSKRYELAGKPYPDGAAAFRWASRTAYDIAVGLTKEASLRKHLSELEAELGINQPTPGTPSSRALQGPLRIEHKLFRDDSGLRRVFFCSWFPALRVMRDNPDEAKRTLDLIAASGYQGIRVFLSVGGWQPYWDGHEVVPVTFQKGSYAGNHLRPVFDGPIIQAWPDYQDLLRTFLRECKARSLRLHVTTGDGQIIFPEPSDKSRELDLHNELASICAQEGGTDVIALAEVTNEYPINRYAGDSPESRQQMGDICRIWEAHIPGVITAQGASLSEEPSKLSESCEYSSACATHTTRDPFPTCIKRTFGLVYWEGSYRGFPKPFWQGEPAGPGQDSYARQDDPANLTALYAMHALTGQASNYFNGPAVRGSAPLDSTWGFRELPTLFAAHIPEDIASWDHASNGHGGVEYWWKDNHFITSTYKDWDNSPPRPIAEWTLYAGDAVTTGGGTPPRATGLLVGTFA